MVSIKKQSIYYVQTAGEAGVKVANKINAGSGQLNFSSFHIHVYKNIRIYLYIFIFNLQMIMLIFIQPKSFY